MDMTDNPLALQQIIIAAAKVCVAICYLVIALLYVPSIDAAASKNHIFTVKVVFCMFIVLSIGTYLHIAWFIYTGKMPETYWNYHTYMVFVVWHAISGLLLVSGLYSLVGVRTVNSKAYSDFIDRQIAIESKALAEHLTETELKEIADRAESTYDMARLILKVYK